MGCVPTAGMLPPFPSRLHGLAAALESVAENANAFVGKSERHPLADLAHDRDDMTTPRIWPCNYCGGLSDGAAFRCDGCGAKRSVA